MPKLAAFIAVTFLLFPTTQADAEPQHSPATSNMLFQLMILQDGQELAHDEVLLLGGERSNNPSYDVEELLAEAADLETPLSVELTVSSESDEESTGITFRQDLMIRATDAASELQIHSPLMTQLGDAKPMADWRGTFVKLRRTSSGAQQLVIAVRGLHSSLLRGKTLPLSLSPGIGVVGRGGSTPSPMSVSGFGFAGIRLPHPSVLVGQNPIEPQVGAMSSSGKTKDLQQGMSNGYSFNAYTNSYWNGGMEAGAYDTMVPVYRYRGNGGSMMIPHH